LGTITCRVEIRQPWPPEWTFAATLDLGAGAHTEEVSTRLAQAFSAAGRSG
jgi:hypothetical protein